MSEEKRGTLTPEAWDALITSGDLPRELLIDKDAKKPSDEDLLRIAREIDPTTETLIIGGRLVRDGGSTP